MDEDVTVISHEKLEEDITVISLENTCDGLNETITTKVHLDKTGGNIINFKRDFENTQFEKEEHRDSRFFLQEKMDEDVTVISQEKFEEDITVIYQENLDEDITVISQENMDNDITVISHEKRDVTIIPIIKKETEKSKKDKSTNLLKDEFEVEAILDYEATVSFTLLFHMNIQNMFILYFFFQRHGKYLVKWKNWDDSNNTWEPTQNLMGCGEKLKEFYVKRVAEREAASDDM